MPLLVLPLALSTVTSGHFAYSLLTYVFGHPVQRPAPCGPLMLVCLHRDNAARRTHISYDTYHLLQHRVPFMWELHKVHHSAEVMVGVTKDRYIRSTRS